MLQQTQVVTVTPYFKRWMITFPDIDSLAASSEQEVLSIWEGLGYYSRARNLHRAARMLMDHYDGNIPESPEDLQELPGIGPYTAAAIASIAFGKNIAAVDGNIQRVVSRVFNVEEPVRSTDGKKRIQALADTYLPHNKASVYNQALMDLGAMICTTKNPDCEHCPIKEFCLAYALGVQEERPVRVPTKKPPHLTVTAAIIQKDGYLLLAQRPKNGLLGGLWEFPGGTLEDTDEDLESCLKREIKEELGVGIRIIAPFGRYQHAYTHFRITLHAFICNLVDNKEPQKIECDDLVWVRLEQLDRYPMGKVDRRIARRLVQKGLNGRLSD